MTKKNRALKKTLIELCGWIALAIVAISIFRFDDLRGGLFLDSIQFGQTQGVILSSDYKFQIGAKGGASHSFSIKYEYSIDDAKYTSNKVSFGNKQFGDKEKALNILEKYPVGKNVTVYYEEGNPSISVLNPRRNSNKEFLVVFLFLGALSMLSIFLFLKASRK